jgi:hypothetical protein
MTRLVSFLCLLFVFCVLRSFGSEYPLLQGDPVVGDPLLPTANQTGIIFKRSDGSTSDRVAWTNMTQAALKQLVQDEARSKSKIPRVKTLVEPLLEPEIEETSPKAAAAELKPQPVPKLDRPEPNAGLGALFSSPVMLTVIILLWLANVYAGYEMGVFRNYPPPLTAGVALVLPLLGPILFLCLPTRLVAPKEDFSHEEHAPVELVLASTQTAEAEAAAAAVAAAQPTGLDAHTVVYQRGQYVFNRRFFETKMASFLRVIPSEAEKDLLICIKSARGEYVGPRLTKTTPEDLVLQVRKGDATADVSIPYPEIMEITIKHKDLVPQ